MDKHPAVLYKTLVVGVILLFLGIVIQPAIVIAELEDHPEKEKMVIQLRGVINSILQKYGQNPIINSLCSMILNALGEFGNMLFCILTIILAMPMLAIMLYGCYLGLPPSLLYMSYYIFMGLVYISVFFCPWPWYYTNLFISSKLPLISIYTLSERKDITNLIEDCPCLQ